MVSRSSLAIQRTLPKRRPCGMSCGGLCTPPGLGFPNLVLAISAEGIYWDGEQVGWGTGHHEGAGPWPRRHARRCRNPIAHHRAGCGARGDYPLPDRGTPGSLTDPRGRGRPRHAALEAGLRPCPLHAGGGLRAGTCARRCCARRGTDRSRKARAGSAEESTSAGARGRHGPLPSRLIGPLLRSSPITRWSLYTCTHPYAPPIRGSA